MEYRYSAIYLKPNPQHIERGPAKYFHGRHHELNHFKGLLHETVQKGIGSSILIQGPPGVGKSALIHEYRKIAQNNHWHVIRLTNRSLYDAQELFRRITQNKNAQDIQTTYGIDLKLFKVALESQTSKETDYLNEAMIQSKPTVLYLDEAQTLGGFLSDEKRERISDFFNTYHNVESKHGFILLLGGLSNMEEVLQDFGVSRFNAGCIYYLKALEPHAEKAIIHDWLTKEIKTPSDTTPWIHAMTQETDRWPRHIQSYCNALSSYLTIGELLTDQRLKQVLTYGNDLKKKYYKQRCRRFYLETKALIAWAIKQLPEQFRIQDMILLLSKAQSSEKADDLYQKVLSQGIIDMDGDDSCSIPIPSLRSFIIDEYGQKNPRISPLSGGLSIE